MPNISNDNMLTDNGLNRQQYWKNKPDKYTTVNEIKPNSLSKQTNRIKNVFPPVWFSIYSLINLPTHDSIHDFYLSTFSKSSKKTH